MTEKEKRDRGFLYNANYDEDIPSNVIAAGVPCRVMREITEADKNRYPHYKENT